MEEDFYMTPQMEDSFANIDRLMRESNARLATMMADMQATMQAGIAELQNQLKNCSRNRSHPSHRSHHTSHKGHPRNSDHREHGNSELRARSPRHRSSQSLTSSKAESRTTSLDSQSRTFCHCSQSRTVSFSSQTSSPAIDSLTRKTRVREEYSSSSLSYSISSHASSLADSHRSSAHRSSSLVVPHRSQGSSASRTFDIGASEKEFQGTPPTKMNTKLNLVVPSVTESDSEEEVGLVSGESAIMFGNPKQIHDADESSFVPEMNWLNLLKSEMIYCHPLNNFLEGLKSLNKFDSFRYEGITSMMGNKKGLEGEISGNVTECEGYVTGMEIVSEVVRGLPVDCIPVQDRSVGFDYKFLMASIDTRHKILMKRGMNWKEDNVLSTMVFLKRMGKYVVDIFEYQLDQISMARDPTNQATVNRWEAVANGQVKLKQGWKSE